MTDGIKSPVKEARRQALVLLGQAVCRQPSWLYKITQLSLFRELIKLLKVGNVTQSRACGGIIISLKFACKNSNILFADGD